MQTIDRYTLLFDACKRIRHVANQGIWNGKEYTAYFFSCYWLLEAYPATVIYTKESGYHSGGWWKSPLYERCWHLSISFRSGTEKNALSQILSYLFAPHEKLLWVEPPYSPEGKSIDTWHYRLFCDEHWQPIMPRGEVYSTQFTERGWRSFSELIKTTKNEPG